MEFHLKLNCECPTNGKGLWSNETKKVKHSKAIIDVRDWSIKENNLYGELMVFFSKKSWNPDKHGLIYTDPLWIKNFRSYLKNNLGFSKKAIKDVDFSEQGMQGNNYVSLDIGEIFVKEYCKLYNKKIIVKS